MSVPLVFLIVLVIALAGVFGYRKFVADSADDLVHSSEASGTAIARQEATARQLDQLDKVVKLLGAVVVLYGIGVACWMAYQAFTNGGQVS